MPQNDVVILDAILQERGLQDSSDFENFAFEQLLKDYDLSNDEVINGKTDGGDDGAIDGIYFFINGNLVQEKIDKEDIKKPIIDLFILQATTSASFSQDKVTKLKDSVSSLLDLTKDLRALQSFYNSDVIEKIALFRESWSALATKHPTFRIHFFYASKGDRSQIHDKVKRKGAELKLATQHLVSGADVEVDFFGAKELLEHFRKEKSYTLQLTFTESFSSGDENYVTLNKLADYFKFVTDESGELRKYIFDSNVRDYQGEIEVNKDIASSLASTSAKADFWWLNNGITMLASKASVTGKTINLDDVQIVNGLQTTNCIYNYLRDENNLSSESEKNRSIIIKIIVTTDSAVRDQIIKATNFQTRITEASLRATDELQRNIEDFFLRNGWFYDRRKNYYKNIGKPTSKIIGIPYLSQALMTLVLKEPHIARGRPTSLIKKDEDYQRVFDTNCPIELFLKVAQIAKKIDLELKSLKQSIDWSKKRNLRFHITLIYAIKATQKKDYNEDDLLKLDADNITPQIIEESIEFVTKEAEVYAGMINSTLDVIAKSKGFLDHLYDNM